MNKLLTIKRKLLTLFVLIFAFAFIVFVSGCEGGSGKNNETYKVTFILNDGNANVVKEVENGNPVTMPDQPIKDDYEFIGWFIDGVEYDFTNPITKDITIEARFEIDKDIAEKYTVKFMVDGEQFSKINVLQDRCVPDSVVPFKKEGCDFDCWLLNGKPYDFTTQVSGDLELVAKFKPQICTVTFISGTTKTEQKVEYGNPAIKPADPVIENKQFYAWYFEGEIFDFDLSIKSDITLNAKFKRANGISLDIVYDFGYECYQTKEALRIAYYTDFYNFLLEKEAPELERFGIKTFADFDNFMMTFKYRNSNEMQTIGNAFGHYYLTRDENGVVENQPTDTFIGYIYQQGKYHEFIAHLVEFFAYWRTDEGYSQSDPHGNDFFYSNWASMVDTAKFFFFDDETLQTANDGLYKWFRSQRVHYALNHIPSVGYVRLTTCELYEDSVTLPQDVTRPGYVFLGWFDDNNNKITEVYDSMTVHAHWEEAPVKIVEE